MSSSPARQDITEHIPQLDVLRAVAFLSVFGVHYMGAVPGLSNRWNGMVPDFTGWSPGAHFLLPLLWGGTFGVPLFFVLSGFCIHLSFLRRPASFRVKDFYWRRFLRIYPAYVGSLVFCVLFAYWIPSKYQHFYQIPVHLLLVHNLFKCTFEGINSPFWSLGVEFQFYLAYPLLLAWSRRWGLTRCLAAALVINLLMQIYFSATRQVIDSPVSVDWSFPLVTWCDWILGACLAEAYVNGRRLFSHGTAILLISLVLFIVSENFKTLHTQSYLFASVLSAAIMDKYLAWRRAPSRLERVLVPVGLVSYSLYLWHMPLIILGSKFLIYLQVPGNGLTWAFVYLPFIAMLLALASILSYRYLEIGVPRLLKRKAARPKLDLAEEVPATR